MSKTRWFDTTPGAWAVLILSVVGGGVFSYLKPIVGIPLLVALTVFGLWLLRRAYKIARETRITKDDTPLSVRQETQTIREIPKPLIPKEIEDIFFAMKVNWQVQSNHGHRDTLRIDAELKDGRSYTEVLDGNCGVCGKPRSQATKKRNKRAKY